MTNRKKKTPAKHKTVKPVNEDTSLQMLKEAEAEYKTSSPLNSEELRPADESRLIDSMEQARLDKTIRNDDVMKLAKGWVSG